MTMSQKKIAANLDRLQSTIEEMINLKNNNNEVLKDNWAQNNFDEIRRYVKQGSDFSKELTAILQERVEAEMYYSRCLSKLGAKLHKACRESVGSCVEAWKQVAHEMEKRAEVHRNYSNACSEELVKPMKNFLENQLKLRKKIEGNVDKTSRALVEWRGAETRAKKQSHSAARDNEKLQDSVLDTSRMPRSSSVGHIPQSALTAARADRVASANDKDSAKMQLKKRKTEDAVKKTEYEYYTTCVHTERNRLEWETSALKGAGMLESLEEERLVQLKSAADCYLRLTAAVPPLLADVTNALVSPISNANATADMRAVKGVRSVPAGASEQVLPDFYCEHTTLAMNRERRKQALMNILQLVKQDIDKERKSKQGLEKLSGVIKETPTFGSDDSQQDVADKIYHIRCLLTYLEAIRYKIMKTLGELDCAPAVKHPLSGYIEVTRDRQGLQQSVLKMPPWLQADYQSEVNKNMQPNYTSLSKSVRNGGEERERRPSIMSRASSKLRIEHLSFRRNVETKSAPASPVIAATPEPRPPPLPTSPPPAAPPPPPDSPLDWSERGAGDGLSNRQDSDFDEFSQSGSSTDLTAEAVDQPAPSKSIGKCRALYAYKPQLMDELKLTPGDIINIHEKQGDGWWSGDLNGNFGIFPATYVEEITTAI